MTGLSNAAALDAKIVLAYERARVGVPWSVPWHALPSQVRRALVAECLRIWKCARAV